MTSQSALENRVLITPGASALTWMFEGPSSSAMTRVNMISPALETP